MAAPRTKIFVGHLPDGCKNEDLENLFRKFGNVKECDVINKYGFVHMTTPEEADDAIKNLNNYNFMGSSLSVEPSKSKLHPEPGAPGRAKQTFGRSGGGGPSLNGYRQSRGSYGGSGGYSNGYRGGPPQPFGSPSGDSYYDRPYSYGGRDRMRPYPSPYERRSPAMMPMRDEYVRRALPPSGDPYARPIPSLAGARDDLYERRAMVERNDYLYSRRSPPMMNAFRSSSSYYDFESSYESYSARSMPPVAASRRPNFY